MPLLLGLDVGTTSIKAVVYDSGRGEIVAQAAAPTPTSHPRPGWTNFDAEGLWQGVVSCTKQALAALPPASQVAAVAVASMGEAGVPVDKEGTPLYPVIAWHDPRSEPQATRLGQTVGPEAVHRLTGQQVRHIFGAPKMLWLRENEPAVFKRLARWLSVEDFILWRLSGVAATDYTIAARTMLFDVRRAGWSAEMLAACGFAESILPQPFPSGAVIGQVTAQAARQTGLPAGLPVSTGGHDHLCGALAAGAVDTGRVLDSSGTAQAVLIPSGEFKGGGAVFANGFSCYHHVLRGRYIIQGGLTSAGSSLEWLLRLTRGPDERAIVFSEAEQSGAGAHGVLCLPHFMGSGTPYVDTESRGAFIGVSLGHTRGDLLRALIEGQAYTLRLNLERLAEAAPLAPGYLIAIGGANREPLMLQTKADICRRPVRAPEVREATALGAALLAGLGCGVFADDAQAAASVHGADRSFEPQAEHCALYDTWFEERFRHLYDALRPVFAEAGH